MLIVKKLAYISKILKFGEEARFQLKKGCMITGQIGNISLGPGVLLLG